jgi:acyl-CoA dehydrogenase
LRTQVANAALNAKDRLPQPVTQLAMKVLRPPKTSPKK